MSEVVTWLKVTRSPIAMIIDGRVVSLSKRPIVTDSMIILQSPPDRVSEDPITFGGEEVFIA